MARISNWQLIAGPASGGYDTSLTEARNRRFTAKLVEPPEVAFTLDGRHPQATAIQELSSDVHVLWTAPSGSPTVPLFRGRAGTNGDTVDIGSHSVEVSSLGYRALLNRRRLFSSSTKAWTATDVSTIAWNLLTQTQTRPGGNLGISRGSGQVTGVVKDRTYEAGDSVGEKIQELSEMTGGEGFDWEVTPLSASALSFDIWYPQRGASQGVVLEYGGLVTKFRREVSSADYANAVRFSGKTDASPPLTPVELEAADIATVPQGRWDAVYGDDSLTTPGQLLDRTLWQLAQQQVVRPSYTVTLRPGAWDGPTHLWVGDTARLVLDTGRLDIDSFERVFEITFGLGGDGDELVEVTLSAPRPDYRRTNKTIDRRLANLERR